MIVSAADANTMYLGGFPGWCPNSGHDNVPVSVYDFTGATPTYDLSPYPSVTSSTFFAPAHTDCRSLFNYYDNTTTPATNILFIGSDGGMSYTTIGNTPISSTPVWKNINGTGFTCSLPWDIASCTHNGNVSMGFSDNNILCSSETTEDTWNVIECSDGGDVSYGKRPATRNTLFFGESGGG